MRPAKREYYLNIAFAVAQRGTCVRRNYGAVIVKDDEIVGTGYTGSPRGERNCCDSPEGCARDYLKIPPGERYELCKSVHAEANAIISAGRRNCIGSVLYIAGFDVKSGNRLEGIRPCAMCQRLIINAGIEKVIT
jgi:dCMP deaminase